MKKLMTVLSVLAVLAFVTPGMTLAGEGCGSCKEKQAAKDGEKCEGKEKAEKDKDSTQTVEKKEEPKKG